MSNLILPIIILIMVIYASYKKVDLYSSFIDGAKESFIMVYEMFPSLLGMIFGVNIFLKSNILNDFLCLFKQLFINMNIPFEIIPMALVRPISGSSSLAILNNLLDIHTPDSYIGRIASVLQGSTDTTFYVLTLYFGSVGIKKIKHAMIGGLIADLAGILASIFFVKLLFY